MSITDTTKHVGLTTDEMTQIRTQGYLGPYPMCSPKEMDSIRSGVGHFCIAAEGASGDQALERN